jgi:hypothetical protein
MSYPGGVHTVKNERESASNERGMSVRQTLDAVLTEWRIFDKSASSIPLW